MLFCCKKNSKKNSVLAFQQFLQKKESINGEKNELICMLKKFKEKNWCNNFDYNDGQCKNSVITKQCNSSARWQKQTNKQTIWWSSRKKIVLEKVTFSEKFRAGFMIFQYSMKKTLYIPTNPSKTLQRKKMAKKWPKMAKKFLFICWRSTRHA